MYHWNYPAHPEINFWMRKLIAIMLVHKECILFAYLALLIKALQEIQEFLLESTQTVTKCLICLS